MEIAAYKLINLEDFDALGVPQAYYTKQFQDLSELSFMVCKWEDYGILINGEIIFPRTNGINPYALKKNAIWIDEERNVWWGLLDVN